MAVSTTNAYSGPYTANGSTTSFPFTFSALSSDDVAVLLRTADGTETVADTDDYTVTFSGAVPSAGSVVFDTAPASGVLVFPYLDVSFVQQTQFADGSAWKAAAVNNTNDRSALRDQVLKRDLDRALVSPLGESGIVLPSTDERAGAALFFDDDGNATTITPDDYSAPSAEAAARSELALAAATALVPGVFFDNTTDGLAGTTDEQWFVTWEDSRQRVYLNDGGSAVLKTELATAALLDLTYSTKDSLLASTGSNLVGFLQSGTGAVARTTQAKMREVSVSITDFGAVSGGSRATNEAAFAAAIAEVQSRGGGIVHIPVGQFDANTISVPDGPAVRFVGLGEQSIIRTTSATADLMTLTAWYSGVERIKFVSSVTRTAGYYVHLLGAHTYAERNHFVGDFVGVKMTGVGAKVARNVFSEGANGARRIWATGGDTSQTIENNLMAAQSAGVSAGIFVDNSGALKIFDNDIIGQGRCLHIAPGAGQSVFSLWSRDNFYDTATYGIAIEPSSTGAVYRTTIEDDWASSHTQSGILLSASGSAVIDGVDIDGTETHLNGVDGIALTGSGVSNVRINGLPLSRQNTGSALSIGAGVSKTIVDGLQCEAADGLSANANGISINGSAGSYEIKNCNVTGQTTANIAGWSPGDATKTIQDCKGFVTRARGVATIANGAGSVAVTHGLSGTPTRIVATPRSDNAGRHWCEEANRTSTQFTVNQSNTAVGYAVKYDWEAFYE